MKIQQLSLENFKNFDIDDTKILADDDKELEDLPPLTILLPDDVEPEPVVEPAPHVTRSGRVSKLAQRLEPTFTGKSYDTVNLNVATGLDYQFAGVYVTST